MRKHIKVMNPLNGLQFTSRQRAKRYVAAGMAQWVEYGSSIKFIRSEARVTSIIRRIDATAAQYDRASHGGLATLDALANTPVVAAGVLLNVGKRKGASRQTFLAIRGHVR